MIAAAKSLPRLGGALATVAATRLTALRALRFKYSKLVEPNFAMLFALTSPPQLASSQTGWHGRYPAPVEGGPSRGRKRIRRV